MLGIADQAPRNSLLQGLQGISQRWPLGFAQQQVYMLWHDYIAIHAKLELAPHTFQRRFEHSHCCIRGKQWMTMITAKCNEMALLRLLKAFESPRHEDNLLW